MAGSLGPHKAVKQQSPRALGADAGATGSPRVIPRVLPEGLGTPALPGWLRHKSRPQREKPSCWPFPLMTEGTSPAQEPSDVSFRKTPQRHRWPRAGSWQQAGIPEGMGRGTHAQSPALGSILRS